MVQVVSLHMSEYVSWSPKEKTRNKRCKVFFDARASPLALKKVRRSCTHKSVSLHNCASPINHEMEVQTPSAISEILSTRHNHNSSDEEHTEDVQCGDNSTDFYDTDDEDKFDSKCLPIYEDSSEEQGESEVQVPMIGPQLQPRCQSIPRADSSICATIEKLSHESIGTFVAHECMCGSDCTRHFSRDQIRPLREATVAMEQQGQKLCDIALAVVNICKENIVIHGETKFDFKICSVSVCEDVFRLAHGLSASAMKIAKAAARKNLALCPQQPRKKKAFSSSQCREEKQGKSERAEQCLLWVKDWIDMHGCKMPDSNLVYVDDVSLPDLHKQYCQDTNALCLPLKERQFKRYWKRNFGKWVKKRARKPFGTCTECAGFKARLAANARDKMAIEEIKAQFYDHLNMQKIERSIYYKHRKKGMEGDSLSIIVDGMDQSKLTLPHYKLTPKDVSNFLETKITGVLVHGKVFDCYISEPQVRHDTNLNLTCVHNTLMSLMKKGPLPPILYLQVDGGSENKNQWMLSYLSLLIEMGMFSKIKMSFLPVGHTHEDIDQAFSRIAVYLGKHDAYTYDEFVSCIQKSFLKENRPPNVITLGHAFDFKAWLKDRLPEVKSWTDNLCYRFAKNCATSEVEMHYKFLSQSPFYLGATPECRVTSFKHLHSQVATNAEMAITHAGIAMPSGIPSGVPPYAQNIVFGVEDNSDETPLADTRLFATNLSICSLIFDNIFILQAR